ncbi:MAG: hypothetical protein U0Q15_07430 [Kineosporiaceae bacterium]
MDGVLLTTAFWFAVASAFIPILNIELYVVGAATATDTSWVWLVLVVSTGQTLGKLGLFFGARYAKAGFLLRRTQKARHEADVLTSDPEEQAPAQPSASAPDLDESERAEAERPRWWRRAWRRCRHWVAVGCARSWEIVRGGGWGALAILFLSSAVGFPPLYATAVLAGATSMRWLPFALVTWVGRVLRFGGLLLIPLWFGTHPG